MSGPASLFGHWYATGPADKPFRADDPDWNIHRIVEDTPGLPDVLVENAGGQRFLLARVLATAIALPPSDLERTIP
ncbi:hypothetical protein LX81_03042 [Palleronia aestuarii]|uniref:Uncharacterized protein n=1 Tax=Palleronia aestuarii TaxID=568105 RepID=A0A2W7N3I5_9RHOB|nr:hypothetical protein [Palleronia aestuarii]PZX14243.1 hypothetical protein LX81_03042 [Palleronia aestuarii]